MKNKKKGDMYHFSGYFTELNFDHNKNDVMRVAV